MIIYEHNAESIWLEPEADASGTVVMGPGGEPRGNGGLRTCGTNAGNGGGGLLQQLLAALDVDAVREGVERR